MVSTGGGFKARTLYTDGEQTILDVACPIILNGIPQCAENSDLLSRSLLVEQPPRNEEDQRTEEELDARYEAVKGRVFGGILDLLSNGLKNYPTTKLARLPRMADSVKWITACYGDDTFLEAFKGNEEEATECGLDSSPIARAVIKILGDKSAYWEGTASELLEQLSNHTPYEQRGKGYPTDAKSLGMRLRRDTPFLLKAGFKVEKGSTHGGRFIRIDRVSSSGAA